MPANDMMFAVSPMKYIGMNASATAMGSVTMARAAPPKSSRNTITISETMMLSSTCGTRERADGTVDQIGAVVSDDNLDAGWQ